MKIKISDILFSNSSMTEKERTEKLYNDLIQNIQNEEIILDFSDTGVITTAFFNDTIGKLFLNLELNPILKNLKIINIKNDDAKLLKVVIDLALQMRSKTNL